MATPGARKSPGSLMPVGETSMFYPAASIKRVVHDRLAGYFIELQDGKVPLRLAAEAWKELDLILDRLQIAHS